MSNTMTSLDNVRKSCKTASTVVKVVSIFVRIGMILAFLGAGILFALHDKLDEAIAADPSFSANISVSIAASNISLDSALQEFIDNGQYAIAYGTVCIVAGLALVFMLIVLRMIRRIFTSILNSESPFSNEVIVNLKKSFILLTIFLCIACGLGIAVFIGVFFWCIYTIFQYGAQLQKEADETL